MKHLKAALRASVIGVLLTGCVASPDPNRASRRFHEGSHVDAVLQFSSWDYTFLVQPRYQENGFLRQVRRESLGQVLDSLEVRRDLAVVVIGWTYEQQELDRLVPEWKSILGGCGFRRVVFLRSNAYNKLNGSLIIDDSNPSAAAAGSTAGRPNP